MKVISATLVSLLFIVSAAAQQKDKTARLQAMDSNKDGKLSRDELGAQFWARASGFDANGDGALDAAELAAMNEKGRRGKEAPSPPGGVNTAFEVREFKGRNGETIRYSLYVPKDKPAGLPLALCLHGAGGNTDAANLLAAPEAQSKHPCIVMAPACDGKNTRWAKHSFRDGQNSRSVMPEMMEALDAAVAETKADPKRLYVTGQSMGGVGTWGVIAEHGAKFAAAIPVCGIWSPEDAARMNGVAVWCFHGAEDKAVPVSGSRDMIAALEKAAVKPAPKYTEFPGVGHGSAGPAYQTKDLWDWMFAQHRD